MELLQIRQVWKIFKETIDNRELDLLSRSEPNLTR